VAFSRVAPLPPLSIVSGALLTSSITLTTRGRPPALEPNTPIAHALRWAPMVRAASRSLGLATSAPRRSQQGQASTSTAHRRQDAAPRQARRSLAHVYC
jgi:hypothetical protein